MAIVSTGIGSGLDISGIVQQLVNAEGAPVQGRLFQKEAAAQSKLSAFGNIQSALSDLKTRSDALKSLDSISIRKATSSDEDAFTATVNSTAAPANYSIEVLNLATAQKLKSSAFADANTAVGTGSLTIGIAGETMTLELDAENNTLSNIRDAINRSTDNPGVSATIVNADAGSYLILTADNTGTANTITISQTGGDGALEALQYPPVVSGDPATSIGLEEATAADDARIIIDTFAVQSSTNQFTDAIEGVTLNVAADTAGTTRSLSVENDITKTSNVIKSFVNAYNSLIDLNKSLTSYDQETNVAGTLIGDATLRGVITQIRQEMNTAVKDIDGPFSLLTDVGIELQVNGKFVVNNEKLESALETDYQRVGQLFSNSDGFGVRVFAATESFLDTNGILKTRTDGLTGQIERINEQRESLNLRLTSLETRLLRQYNALDSLLSELNNTSNFLNSQLQNLPGFTKPD